MRTKILPLLIVFLLTSACGKKVINESGFLGGTTSTERTSQETAALEDEKVDDQNCIDNKLNKDLDSGETISKLRVNNDITFCNGVRLRLKAYEFASKKYKAYGYVISNSGVKTCIKESTALNHRSVFFKLVSIGEQGVLEGGHGIKILLGGHEFDSNKELVPSSQRLSRYVRFKDWGSYTGEMAFYEKDKLQCWAIQ